MQAAGGIKRLTAAVTVAQQMRARARTAKSVTRTPEEIEQAAPDRQQRAGRGHTRGDTMELAELPFNDQFATDVNQQMDRQQTA